MSSTPELELTTLDAGRGPGRGAGIIGLGSALPAAIVDSDAVAQRIGVPPGWIERRTGIHRRRRAGSGDRVWRLGAAAGSEALSAAGLEAEALDLVLVATLSPDDITPNTAPLVAHALGATHAGAIDVGAACTGFVSALELGAACIESGRAETVLVVGAEIMSRFLDHGDRSTAGLFGDGAGAVVLAPGQVGRIGASVLGCDGSAAEFIRAPRATGLIEMDGQETFKRAIATLCENARQTLAANGLTREDVDLFVLHQANGRILTAVSEGLGVEPERVLDVIADVGNTSAASIPLALAQAQRDGRLAAGDRVLLGAVGAGFTWGATVVSWGAPA
jgi:3-oxoacyl-[acyl-carrier-protein] synthase-3